jgi:pimeloyl-ACP methyl ester carboxylesterase
MMPVRYSQFLADNIAGARLEIIPDASHMVILEQPEAVAGAMSSFLSTIFY